MRFVADESCDFSAVRALRAAGHNVSAIAETAPRLEDEEVLKLAHQRGTLLITEDKDFGQLVYANAKATEGVLLLRFPGMFRGAATRTCSHTATLNSDVAMGYGPSAPAL